MLGNDFGLQLPKLRFPEFQGDSPWQKSELGKEASILKGKGISKADIHPDGSQLCIRYGELYTRYGELIDAVASRTNLPAGELFLSTAGDVVIPSSGETKLDIATASCVLRDGIALGGDLNVIRSKVHGPFLSYYLNGPKRLDIAKVAQGDTVVHLYPHQLEKIKIVFPSDSEQQKIAECLGSLDELIGTEREKLEALKAYKKGLMQQLFPREGETVPRLRFPEFRGSGGWEETTLGEVARLRNGYAFRSAEYVDTGEFHILTIANIQQGRLDLSSTKRISELPSDIQSHQILQPNDILISMTGNVGRVCLVEGHRLLLNQRVGKLVAQRVDQGFFYQLLLRDDFRKAMQLKAAGGAQDNLSAGDITEYSFRKPRDDAEQHRIAAFLAWVDNLFSAHVYRLEALQKHKQALMQQLFPSPIEAEA